MNSEKKLFLLDAYALIFRAYYAFIRNPIKNSKGFNTSTIFGFVNTLDEILRKEGPSHIGVVFDPSTPTFRNEIFPAYKANRDETPEDIKASVPWIKKIIEAYNIPILEVPGYEADDVIGTLAKKAERQGYTVYMMTPDKDFGQLVTENVFMYVPRKSGADIEKLGIPQILEKFCVDKPEQVIDVLALWGDTSDNVPGVPGIGEKTAKKLISEYKSVENLLDNLDKLRGKQKENLESSREQLKLSKELVTIKIDVPIEFDPLVLKKEEYKLNDLKQLFQELEFRTLLARLTDQPLGGKTEGAAVQGNLFSDATAEDIPSVESVFETIKTIKKDYKILNSAEEIKQVADRIRESGIFCFDTETTDLDITEAHLVGIAIAFENDKGYYIPVPEDYTVSNPLLGPFFDLLQDEGIIKVGQNLKYDIRIMMNYGIETRGELFDTMVAHYLLQPEQRHGLNVLAEVYLNYRMISIEELIGPKGKRQITMKQVPIEKCRDYACEDADVTWQLYKILKEKLKEKNLDTLSKALEMPLIYVLAEMEHTGVKIDTNTLASYAIQLQQDILNTEEKIFELAGLKFNISSPKQLGEILFDKLKISTAAKKTKTRQYSTSEDVLSKLAGKHQIINEVLNFRSLKKLLSTYVEALPKLICDRTGKVHTSFNQTVAATGRLSSNNPNLQNIPIREERGREIRKAFIPSNPGGRIISADYSQIELRLMAHLSEDENMMDAFRKDKDIHTATAARIYNIPESEVTREMRSNAKTANFGIIYGISAFGLSQRMDISRTEAKELIDGYFRSFPKVKIYMDESIKRARRDGYVYTLMGRRRHLPDIHSRNANVRGMAERNAINAPIQGTAADVIKIAMIRINKRMKMEGLESRMIMQVHDELIFDVVEREAEMLKRIIKTEMEGAMELKVPLTIEMGEGANWLEAH